MSKPTAAEVDAIQRLVAGQSNLDAPMVGDVAPERVEWLWPGRVPFGKLVVLDGDPGLGKSTLMLDIAARCSTGSPLPDGSRLAGPISTLILSAEDSVGDTIRPRLEAGGADLERVRVFRSLDDGEGPRPPVLPGDLDVVEALVQEDGARLVIVDPLMAYLGGQYDAHRDQDVRRALHVFAAWAERTGAALVVVRHLNKAPGGNPIYRGGGSIGIVGAARAGMVIAPDPADEKRRVVACLKSNLSAEPASLAYRLVPDEVHDCARVQWDGASHLRAVELLNPPRESKLAAADGFLENLLADGPVLVGEIKSEAQAEGISWRTVERAKDDLSVAAFRKGEPGRRGGGSWWWKLPDLSPDLEGQPLGSPLADLIHEPISAGESTSEKGQPIKSATPGVAGGQPEAPDEAVPSFPFRATLEDCEVCGGPTFYQHHDGRMLCPRCKRVAS